MRELEYKVDSERIEILAEISKSLKKIDKSVARLILVLSGKRVRNGPISGIGYFCLQEDYKGFYHICDISNRYIYGGRNRCSKCMRLTENGIARKCYYWIVPMKEVVSVGTKVKRPRGKIIVNKGVRRSRK